MDDLSVKRFFKKKEVGGGGNLFSDEICGCKAPLAYVYSFLPQFRLFLSCLVWTASAFSGGLR